MDYQDKQSIPKGKKFLFKYILFGICLKVNRLYLIIGRAISIARDLSKFLPVFLGKISLKFL
jgi:hypothetical protein